MKNVLNIVVIFGQANLLARNMEEENKKNTRRVRIL